MSKKLNSIYYTFIFVILAIDLFGQKIDHADQNEHEYTQKQIEYLINKSPCIVDDRLNQITDTSFTEEKILVVRDGLSIAGKLYVPNGEEKYPLVILVNSGGLDSVFTETFPNTILNNLMHCKIACLIYDPRGTGLSEGSLKTTTYDNYATDVGNRTVFLANHPKIDNKRIGVINMSYKTKHRKHAFLYELKCQSRVFCSKCC